MLEQDPPFATPWNYATRASRRWLLCEADGEEQQTRTYTKRIRYGETREDIIPKHAAKRGTGYSG